MARTIFFAEGERYHLFTRSIDRKPAFHDEADHARFLSLLFAANSVSPTRIYTLNNWSLPAVLKAERPKTLIEIEAFCLMPNHFHIVAHEATEKGISKFMQKLGTAYAMYYNKKYKHVGNVFVGPFRARHIENDSYYQTVVRYVHLNPADLFQKDWRKNEHLNIPKLTSFLHGYQYSSLPVQQGHKEKKDSILKNILSPRAFEHYNAVSTQQMIIDAVAYETGTSIRRWL